MRRLKFDSDEKTYIVAVVGCGGKTTFIEGLAREYRHKKVLVTPTTKMFPMEGRDVTVRKTLSECLEHKPEKGIQCLGIFNEKTGKLEALPPKILNEMSKKYDIVLLEADGSRGLPCKGWLHNEPVVPDYCTHTVGIVTLNAVGKTADESCVFRLKEFLSLTGLRQGEIITPATIEKMVCSSAGMFKNSAGELHIFVNQVESKETEEMAIELIKSIKAHYPGRFAGFAYGSARLNRWKEV